MSRKEFMEQLARLLGGISESERQEALDYYNSYFDDAGPENEAAVIQELGSPGKVAAIIKADLADDGGDFGSYFRSRRRYLRSGCRSSGGNAGLFPRWCRGSHRRYCKMFYGSCVRFSCHWRRSYYDDDRDASWVGFRMDSR